LRLAAGRQASRRAPKQEFSTTRKNETTLRDRLILLAAGCARDVREKTLEMTKQQEALNGLCKQKSRSFVNKFTGSGSTTIMECESSTDINSEEMQEFLLRNGWMEKQRSEEAILYCLINSGIVLVTSQNSEEQKIQTIMQYPSAICGSAFSTY
jgi:hypothetical protein